MNGNEVRQQYAKQPFVSPREESKGVDKRELAALRDTNRNKSTTTNTQKGIKSHNEQIVSPQVGCETVKNGLEVGVNVGSVGEGAWMLEPGYGGLSALQPSSSNRNKTPRRFLR